VASPVRLGIDLEFSLSNDAAHPTVVGSVTADGTDVTVTLREGAVALTDSRTGLALARTVGAELARVGLTVALHTRNGRVGTIGAVRAPWIQRLFTKSPHIKLGSVSALLALRKDGRASGATPIAFPPGTLLPILPTVQRGVRRQVTTTHYLPGSGRPRLIFAVASATWDGRAPREFNLLPETTVIGSSETADLVLPGLDPVHARIVHDDRDEYVLYVTGTEPPSETALLDARPNDGRILRTGALIALGTWRLAFFREEFADHGRPFGGRAGGELAVQRPQPERRRVTPS
jgi:hypothetical protein